MVKHVQTVQKTAIDGKKDADRQIDKQKKKPRSNRIFFEVPYFLVTWQTVTRYKRIDLHTDCPTDLQTDTVLLFKNHNRPYVRHNVRYKVNYTREKLRIN